jgi:hypothetical protein
VTDAATGHFDDDFTLLQRKRIERRLNQRLAFRCHHPTDGGLRHGRSRNRYGGKVSTTGALDSLI